MLKTTDTPADFAPSDAWLWELPHPLRRGMQLCQIDEDYATALPFLRAAAVLHPEHEADALWWAATCYEVLGRYEEAVGAYQRCVDLRPQVPEGHAALERLAKRSD